MSVKFSEEKMYTYLKGCAMGRGWVATVNALSFARELHAGQLRKSGEPYIVHPLTMANHAIALGVHEDEIIATILLHDVCEDCGVQSKELPVSRNVREAVRLLTRVKGEPLGPYYREIGENRVATIAKLFDRCNNVSTMAGVFTLEKLREYIDETREYVLPLLRQAKNRWPNDSNLFFVLKYHIISVIDGLEACLQAVSDTPMAESGVEHEEDICPQCGCELDWDGDRDIQDDGAIASWHCPKCGARGRASWSLVFDEHLEVVKEG